MRRHPKEPAAAPNRGILGLAASALTVAAALLVTVPSVASAAGCTNEALRIQQGTQGLQSCRAYEQVSPIDKNSGDVAITASRVRSAPNGDAITFVSTSAFAGAKGTGSIVDYLARRAAGGWGTEAVGPPQNTNDTSLLNKPNFVAFTESLSAGVFKGAEPSPVPGAPAGTFNLFVRHNETGQFDLATPTAPTGANFFYSPAFAGMSATGEKVSFESPGALTSNAPEDGATKLYEWEAGQLRLAGVLSDPAECAPEPAPCAAPGGSVAGPGATVGRFYTESTVSDDGSHVYFTGEPTITDGAGVFGGKLYVRIDGAITIPVSASQRTEPDPAGPQPATFWLATPDGSKALFTTSEQLVDEDENVGQDLYQFDLQNRSLTLVSKPSEAGMDNGKGVEGVIGESTDGTQVYFISANRLTPATPIDSLPHLYHWNAGRLTYVTTPGDSSIQRDKNWSIDYSFGHESRVSPNGRFVLFSSSENLAGAQAEGFQQLFLYDAANGSLRCVSCSGPGHSEATVAQFPFVSVAGNRSGYVSRALLNDGRVFFSTAEKLAAGDTNGIYDVYEFDPTSGADHLLSNGRGSGDSYFLDADDSGNNVFIVTRQRLVGWDRDNNLDLYDIRVDGGFPEPVAPPPTCLGDSCQQPQSPAPASSSPASSALVGPSNSASKRKPKCGRSVAKPKQKGGKPARQSCTKPKKKSKSNNRKRHAPRNSGRGR